MKTKTYIIILLSTVIVLLASACKGDVDNLNIPNKTNNTQEEDAMEERLLTKEEFLKKVSDHEAELGVTVEDFKDIDVDDFIEKSRITNSAIEWCITGGGDLGRRLELYLANLVQEEIEVYRPKQLRIVESTEEEFEAFKATYFEAIGGVTITVINAQMYKNIEEYAFQEEEKTRHFAIGRTADINQLKGEGWEFFENPSHVSFPTGRETEVAGDNAYTSKNGKFFIIFYGICSLETVKAFCEIDD